MSGREERLVVSLSGGGPWGFRLQGGAGTGLPLIVSKVRRKSKAYKRLREGDRILRVNGLSCEGLTYDQLMDIADKSGTDLALDIVRRECDKENRAPIREVERPQELTSSVETSSKTSEVKECARIQSVTSSEPEEPRAVEPFPSFRELSDSCTSSKQEVVAGDENSFTKTKTERRHEVKGDTETSFMKTEQECFSKSSLDPHGLPDITMDTIDLNNLISETQKRLDSFKNTFTGSSTLDSTLGNIGSHLFSSSVSELSKTVDSSGAVDAASNEVQRQSENLQRSEESVVSKMPEPVKKVPPPALPNPSVQPTLGDAFKDCLREMETDPTFSLPDIGFVDSSETSTVTADIPFGTATTTLMKKKKMFSSSSFYEEPDSIYPTVEEQVEMARKIADSLADDTNKKSKGANMFYKRVKRSTKWIHEGPEPSDESGPGTPELQGVEPPTPDPSQVPFRPSKGPPRLKLVLDPRHTLDLNALRSSGYVISEHNVVSPEVCHGLVKDLQSPVGKGAALFAKRKKKSEEWVVDEEKVKALLREQHERKFIAPPLTTGPAIMNQYSSLPRQDVKLVKSPWEAAMESPFGLCDAAFARVHPGQLADTVIRRADFIRSESLSRESSRMEGCVSPPPLTPAAAMHDIYHAKHPKGWEGSFSTTNYSATTPAGPFPVSTPQPPQNVHQNGFQPSAKKLVFQNFNTVPRLWKGASVH